MTVDIKLNQMIDAIKPSPQEELEGLLDAYGRAVMDNAVAYNTSTAWDDEVRADLEQARIEARTRLLRIRTRILNLVKV